LPPVLECQLKYYQHRSVYIDHLVNGGLMAPTGPEPPGHISAVPKPR